MEELQQKKLEVLYLAGEREVRIMKNTATPASQSKQSPSPTPTSQKSLRTLENVREEIGDCQRCRLSQGRKNIVFGVGNPKAKLMFVGEAPGRDEDIQGEPFVGRAGQLLTKIIEAMGYKREDVYIANVIKCRPPENRNPAPDEVNTCEPFLLQQIEIIQPKVIVCLGTYAAQSLLQTETPIGRLRSHFHAWPSSIVKTQFETSLTEGCIKVMPTYHPAFLLRNPNMKKPVWEDMQKVMEFLKD